MTPESSLHDMVRDMRAGIVDMLRDGFAGVNDQLKTIRANQMSFAERLSAIETRCRERTQNCPAIAAAINDAPGPGPRWKPSKPMVGAIGVVAIPTVIYSVAETIKAIVGFFEHWLR